jgi:hypothetical protein
MSSILSGLLEWIFQRIETQIILIPLKTARNLALNVERATLSKLSTANAELKAQLALAPATRQAHGQLGTATHG